MAGLLFHNFSTFPNLWVFSGKGEGAAWCLMGKTGWCARKKKSERDNTKDISKYKEVVQSNLIWTPPPTTPELWNVFVNTCLSE